MLRSRSSTTNRLLAIVHSQISTRPSFGPSPSSRSSFHRCASPSIHNQFHCRPLCNHRNMSSAATDSSTPVAFPVQAAMEQTLQSASTIAPLTHLEIWNESHKHSVPKNSETHFKVILVSSAFQGQSPIQRHRTVNTLLAEYLEGPVHALSIVAKTPQQWQTMQERNQSVAPSPNCRGGDGKLKAAN